MREIKFRAWGIDTENMWNWGLVQKIDKWWKHDGIILMRYTGLKDKSGKDIYEGDIVECGDYVPDAHAWNTWRREVQWDNEQGMWLGIDGEENHVIGNIYENSDLFPCSNEKNFRISDSGSLLLRTKTW